MCQIPRLQKAPITPWKTNMDTQNDGLEKVTPFLNIAIFGIYVRFLGCNIDLRFGWRTAPVVSEILVIF